MICMAQMLRPWQLQVTRPGFVFLFCWVTLGKLGQLSEPREDNSNTNVKGVLYEVLTLH